jgi:cytochrome c5
MKRFALTFFVASIAVVVLSSAAPLDATAAEAQDQDSTEQGVEQGVEQGKILFEARCPLCHQLPEPSMLKLDQWQRSLKTMQKRMQTFGMSPLTEAEFQQVLAYLATQARD